VLLKNFKNIFFVPELARKLLFTFGVLIVYRIGVYIPVIGINIDMLRDYMSHHKALGGLLQYIDLFSGGALEQCTLFALGIMPYITASIIIQILSMTTPSLEALAKEGEYGRKLINQYTRYIAIGLSITYSLGYAAVLETYNLVLTPGLAFKILFVLSLTIGAMFVMWLGDQISLHGIGNGSSMIMFAAITARIPNDVLKTINEVQIGNINAVIAFGILLFYLTVIACIVFLEKGERKVPVQYARRVIGQRVYGGQNTYIPFKINPVGVMPVIFAQSILQIPLVIGSFLAARFAFFSVLNEWLRVGGLLHSALEFVLIVFFMYIYTELVFKPADLADNMKKSGGFILGLRPGKQTADFFDYLLTRIVLVGALYLAALALMPNIVYAIVGMPFLFRLGGTSLLIVVGVALELAAQIEAYLIEHRYEGFLTTGRMKTGVVR
jgi:preprotein translocase subunit SecY